MRVYKFLPSICAIENIFYGRIMLSTFENLNDPFELLGCDTTNADLKAAAVSAKALSDSKHAVMCFSKNWNNPVLWSHYADSHRGICLGYDINDEFAIEMVYTKERLKPEVDKFGNFDRYKFLDYIKLKYNHWAYEEEVRFVVDSSTVKRYNNRLYYHTSTKSDTGCSLGEIIIGPRNETPIEYLRYSLKCRGVDVPVIKTKLSDSHFEVVAV